ncbi:hypothetical protein Tco_0903772 [Tanacetum coccineum]
MGSITSLKCVLTQEHLDAICAKYFVPEEVHPQLPSPDATMHERPAGKVEMYTRFFDYANYQMDLNAFIRTANPRKVRIVERPKAENERPIVTVAKHRTMTLLPTSVVRSSGELSASVKMEFVGDASVGDGGGQGFDSVGGQDNIELTVPVTEHVETETPGPKRSKKKRVARGRGTPAASHPPKRLRADYGRIGGSTVGGKSPGVLNKLLQDSRLSIEQGVTALPTLPFITSSVTASPLEEGGDIMNFVMVLPCGLWLLLQVAIPANVGKDKSVPHPSVFGASSSSEKTIVLFSLFVERSGSVLLPWEYSCGGRLQILGLVLVEGNLCPRLLGPCPRVLELNDGRSCANMIDHFTPPAFFKTVHRMEHEQLFTEFNVSTARNLSLSSEMRMRVTSEKF